MSEQLCPHFKTPCKKEKCRAWVTDVVEENGVTKARSDCIEYFWIPLYLKSIAHRADGTQRAVEGMRNTFHEGSQGIVASLLMTAKNKMLGDNSGRESLPDKHG